MEFILSPANNNGTELTDTGGIVLRDIFDVLAGAVTEAGGRNVKEVQLKPRASNARLLHRSLPT